ncbi:hypothetical protein RHMOL_Rhmol13G0189100 [Rhododendron molle]|uniref:Uncharacterized protein n=1 Tax=Rhododendron molle TaxID=49168 RepID=A0ACC0L8J3_RHOML|nr:hypothetical protein RHMOL_Rhmol13G0189100 [Rhododendron molle]
MGLKWLLRSTYMAIIFGHPNAEEIAQKGGKGKKFSNEKQVDGEGIPSLEMYPSGFQMPLHYPRYKKVDYEKMEASEVDVLLRGYGLSFKGTLDEKRAYAMGAFLWPDQL